MSAIVTDAWEVFTFVRSRLCLLASENMRGIGLKRDGEMVAGVVYEGWNGQQVWMHVAAAPGRRWMTREYLRYCFEYPFNELGAKQVRGWVNADNAEARRFDEHLGFEVEAVLNEAGPGGVDVLVYVMRREACRFINQEVK